MQNFSDATYKNILDYMLSLVPDTYDKRDTSPIQTSLGPAAYVLEGFYLSLDLVQKQAFVQTASGDSLDLARVLAALISLDGVVNVSALTLNGIAADMALQQTGALQQVPVLGKVELHGT